MLVNQLAPQLTSLCLFASHQTGCSDIVIGRDDGSLEVWDIDESGTPQKVFSAKLPESICSVDGGYVTSASSPDIIVHTFSGKVSGTAGEPQGCRPAWCATVTAPGMRHCLRCMSVFFVL